MVDRYATILDVQEHLELGTLDETNYPKQSKVESWITASEEEIDDVTQTRWDLHTVIQEKITPDSPNIFFLNVSPLQSITLLEYNAGDEWTTSWTSISTSNYRIVDANSSKIKTKDSYYGEEKLRVTYIAGYERIPKKLTDLCVLLVERRYIMSRLGIDAADPDVISVAAIRTQNKSEKSLKYRLEGLSLEIKEHFDRLGKLFKVKNFNFGTEYQDDVVARDRQW